MGTIAEQSVAKRRAFWVLFLSHLLQSSPLPENSNRWRTPLWVTNDRLEKASLFLQHETDQGAQRGATSSVNYMSLSRLPTLCSSMPNDLMVTRFALPFTAAWMPHGLPL